MEMDPLRETKAQLKEMFRLLCCTKCGELSKESVWILSACQHKYCKKCFDSLKGNVKPGRTKKCTRCHRLSPFDSKSSLPDLFSTDLLRNLREFQLEQGIDFDKNSLRKLESETIENLRTKPINPEYPGNDKEVVNVSSDEDQPTNRSGGKNRIVSDDDEDELFIPSKEPLSKKSSVNDTQDSGISKTIQKTLQESSVLHEKDGIQRLDKSLSLVDAPCGGILSPASSEEILNEAPIRIRGRSILESRSSGSSRKTRSSDDRRVNTELTTPKTVKDLNTNDTECQKNQAFKIPTSAILDSSTSEQRNNSSITSIDGGGDDGDFFAHTEEDAQDVEPKKAPPARKFFRHTRGERSLSKPPALRTITTMVKKVISPTKSRAQAQAKTVANVKSKSISKLPEFKSVSPHTNVRKQLTSVSAYLNSTHEAGSSTRSSSKKEGSLTPKPSTSGTSRPNRSKNFSKSSTASKASTLTEPKLPETPIPTVSTRKRNASNMSVSSTSSVKSSVASSPSLAAVNRKNAKGETQLHIAARNGNAEKIEQLLELGAEINAQDFAGWTSLHEAITGKTCNTLKVMEILLSKGCQVNVIGGFGHTPLHEAARVGSIDVVKLLMSYGASNEITNENGLLPGDLAKTREVLQVIQKYKGPYKRKSDGSDVLSISRLRETNQRLVLFAYQPESSFLEELTEEFQLRSTTTFAIEARVTHVVFDVKVKTPVLLTLNYLCGILSGAWLLRKEWLTESLSGKTLLDPNPFEIEGYSKPNTNSIGKNLPISEEGSSGTLRRTRLNRERKNPGLFQGMSFYIYKNTAYNVGTLKLTKSDIAILIRLGDGQVLNREPNPDMVDPFDSLIRFHAKEPSHKLVLTSHVILFGDDKNEPTKKHNLEHVKSLRVNWLIESALNFTLLDPTPFL